MFKTLAILLSAVSGVTPARPKRGWKFPHWLAAILQAEGFSLKNLWDFLNIWNPKKSISHEIYLSYPRYIAMSDVNLGYSWDIPGDII
jgi:hypothetical protein